jgi:hypothetical protein
MIVDTSSAMPAPAMLIASDVRQAMVRLLLARPHHVSAIGYLIIPARKGTAHCR